MQSKPFYYHFYIIFAAMLSLVSCNAQAFCGFFAGKADASLFNEASQVILVRDGNRSVISMLNDYKGPLKDFALVVPVPHLLQEGQVQIGDKRIFDRLDAYSSPRLAEYFDPDPCPVGKRYNILMEMEDSAAMPMARASIKMKKENDNALGVAVEASYTVGEYDIVMLSAKQSDGLETWLRQNGYKIPKGAAAALNPYIAQDMKFFVAKVNLKEQAKTGSQFLRPIQFAFESEKFMLPIRLGMINADPSKPQDLIAYVLTKNGRVESANYRTVKLPANQNLPPAIKKDFKTFYKTMFDYQAKQEDHRVVFTEYFWDMSWCDPCAAEPLSGVELNQAGVFWLDNNDVKAYQRDGGAQNALLTRLHVRYTSKTFPEDLMFVQTSDRQNWQTRYVVQNPYEDTVEQCHEKAANFNCEESCRNIDNGWRDFLKGTDRVASCIQSCQTSIKKTVEAAHRYYETDLPHRQQAEIQTLMRFTGWSQGEAERFIGFKVSDNNMSSNNKKWWETLFKKNKANP
jgi:hypothetical protein